MNTIHLDNTLPNVFLSKPDLQSDIWRRQVCFEKGNTYLIAAGSGTGKSSLCSFIIGSRQDFEGKILFEGKDTSRLGTKEWSKLRQNNISLLFQELRLFPELTAMENVEIKNSLTHFKSKQEIQYWFEILGIADKMSSPVKLMSFGQQQRVAMIRALVQPFDFLLADEPVSHLDEKNSQIMADIMMEEVRRQGAGVIITSIGKHMTLPYNKVFSL